MHNLAFRGLRLPRLGAMRGVGGASGFNWLDANSTLARLHDADGFTAADASGVSAWANTSPETFGTVPGYAQAVSSKRPILGTAGGHRYVRADGGATPLFMTTSRTYSNAVDTHFFILGRVRGGIFGNNFASDSADGANAKIGVNNLSIRAVGNPEIWGNDLDTVGNAAGSLTADAWTVTEAILRASGTSVLKLNGAIVVSTTAAQETDVILDTLFGKAPSSNIDVAFLAAYDISTSDLANAGRIYDELAARRTDMNP